MQYKQDMSLVGVQSKSGDSTIKSLIQLNDTLSSNPKEISVEYHNTRIEKQTDARIKNYIYVVTTVKNSNKELSKLSGITYLSISKHDKKNWIYLGAFFITILISLNTIYKGFRTKRVANETYDSLYNKFPELENNLNKIIINASYKDEDMKIAIIETI